MLPTQHPDCEDDQGIVTCPCGNLTVFLWQHKPCCPDCWQRKQQQDDILPQLVQEVPQQ